LWRQAAIIKWGRPLKALHGNWFKPKGENDEN